MNFIKEQNSVEPQHPSVHVKRHCNRCGFRSSWWTQRQEMESLPCWRDPHDKGHDVERAGDGPPVDPHVGAEVDILEMFHSHLSIKQVHRLDPIVHMGRFRGWSLTDNCPNVYGENIWVCDDENVSHVLSSILRTVKWWLKVKMLTQRKIFSW